MKLNFEWDEEKARTNLKKHRVCFDEDNRKTLPQDAQKGRSARPQRVRPEAYPLGYVEDLNDARTKLAGFFSILLESYGGRAPICA